MSRTVSPSSNQPYGVARVAERLTAALVVA
jgi:hypothetical protein